MVHLQTFTNVSDCHWSPPPRNYCITRLVEDSYKPSLATGILGGGAEPRSERCRFWKNLPPNRAVKMMTLS